MNKKIIFLFIINIIIFPNFIINANASDNLPDFVIVGAEYREDIPASLFRDVTIHTNNIGYIRVAEEGSGVIGNTSLSLKVTGLSNNYSVDVWTNNDGDCYITISLEFPHFIEH